MGRAPKVGKSYVSLSMAAGVTRGAAAPHGSIPEAPASVILMSAEDDPSRTIIPRLMAAGADLARVHILESVVLAGGNETLPSLRTDMAQIAAAADRLGDCRLIVVDPVSAYLGGVDDHRNAEVRGILSPLKAMAERLNAAVVLLSHLSKGGSTNAQQRVIGSIAYVGACRANFLFVKDREDPTGRRVLMLDNGGNLAPPASTLAYRIEDRGEGTRVEWLDDPLPITAEEALAADQAACQASVAPPERREAEGWLAEAFERRPDLGPGDRGRGLCRRRQPEHRPIAPRSVWASSRSRTATALKAQMAMEAPASGRPRSCGSYEDAHPPFEDAPPRKVSNLRSEVSNLRSPNRRDARNRRGVTDGPTIRHRTDPEGVTSAFLGRSVERIGIRPGEPDRAGRCPVHRARRTDIATPQLAGRIVRPRAGVLPQERAAEQWGLRHGSWSDLLSVTFHVGQKAATGPNVP